PYIICKRIGYDQYSSVTLEGWLEEGNLPKSIRSHLINIPEGFEPWFGRGGCPLQENWTVEVIRANGERVLRKAKAICWHYQGQHDGIIAYRIVDGVENTYEDTRLRVGTIKDAVIVDVNKETNDRQCRE